MTSQPLSGPPTPTPLLADGKTLSPAWSAWFTALWRRVGGLTDKVDQAVSLASAAAPGTSEIVASGGLQRGGAIGGNVGVSLYVAITTVAMLPASGVNFGDWAYAEDGLKPGETTGNGTGVPVFFAKTASGTAWISACSGAAVSA